MKELNPEKYASDDYEKHKEQIIEKLKSHPKILKVKDKIRNQCLVACITDKNGENMWKNYAQNGEGVCFEYNIDDVVLSIKSDLRLWPVRYVNDRNVIDDIHFKSVEFHDTDEAYKLARNKYILSCMTKNSFPFCNEYEWRLLCEYMELEDGASGKLFDFISPTKIILGKNIAKNPVFEQGIIDCAKSKNIAYERRE